MVLYLYGCVWMFIKFYFLILLLLLWLKYLLGLNMICGLYFLSMYFMWIIIMMYVLLEYRCNVWGFIIDIFFVLVVVKSFVEMIKGRDELLIMLEYFRGDDFSFMSVL